jgi:hypothetical protein
MAKNKFFAADAFPIQPDIPPDDLQSTYKTTYRHESLFVECRYFPVSGTPVVIRSKSSPTACCPATVETATRNFEEKGSKELLAPGRPDRPNHAE